jgi:hypothetical protein
LQGLYEMLQRENWVADNDCGRKRKAHGEDLDESTEQESAEEGAGSEKKCCVHGDAEQVHRHVAQSRSGVGKVKIVSNMLLFLQKTCVNFVWSTSVFCPQQRVGRDNGKIPRPIAFSA